MHSGSQITSSQSVIHMSLGIASLIFEGRLLSDDDFAQPHVPFKNVSINNFPTTSKSTEPVQDAQRIIQKLQQLRACPGTSKDAYDCTLTIDNTGSGASADECDDDIIYDDSNNSKSDGIYLGSLKSLASSCLKTTPRTLHKTINLNVMNPIQGGQGKHFLSPATVVRSHLTSALSCGSTAKLEPTDTMFGRKKEQCPRQGPHCESFLKNIAVLKVAQDDSEEDHICSEVFNKHCRSWCFSQNQIKSILSRGEHICIEVFLGPETNPILMEQWIIQITDTFTYPTMTIQSLCSAIRSQLYFSQISAWTDLIKGNESEYTENSRVKIRLNNTPRLDIFYRIKSNIVMSSFLEKPIIHNFPDAPISDNLAIRVQLKSCKRLDKIPESIPLLILVDDQRGPCTEKGKHRCKNSFDDEPINDDTVENLASTSTSCHRERQLMKYKKRLLKREKKKKIYMHSDCLQNAEATKLDIQLQNFSTHASINSIRPPLYITSPSPSSPSSSSNDSCVFSQATQTTHTEMMSVSTQTDNVNIGKKRSTLTMSNPFEDDILDFPSCDFCGSGMQCICWNCDKLFKNNNNSNEKLDNGDLLLQSIQRTALKKNENLNKFWTGGSLHYKQKEKCSTISSPKKYTVNSTAVKFIKSNENHINSSNEYFERSTCDNLINLDLSDCRLCIKRQKTKHNYNNNSKYNPSNSATLLNYRRTMSESIAGFSDDEVLRSNTESTSMNCGLTFEELKSYRRAFSDDCISDSETVNKCQCAEISPESISPPQRSNHNNCLAELPTIKKNITSPLSIKCPIELGRIIPKLNLTSIFDSPGSPPALLMNGSSDIFPIHKSNSAPTFNQIYSPTLSPRFYKQAAILKRRSRHLSEKSSERSSIGSEEQFSDEEYGCGLDNTFSPSISPSKPFYKFGKPKTGKLKPLLGTLEESLFQNRLEPKFQIQGYKVLLGASGGFCPTQLTIPAVTNLYELNSGNISTPYVVSYYLSITIFQFCAHYRTKITYKFTNICAC